MESTDAPAGDVGALGDSAAAIGVVSGVGSGAALFAMVAAALARSS